MSDNILTSLEILLDELDSIIPDLNQQGARLMDEKKYAEARQVIAKAEAVVAFQAKVQGLREEWVRMAVPPTRKPKKKVRPIKRTMTTMLETGLRTPNQAYLLPILQALVRLGGSGKVGAVLDLVEEIMGDQLNKYDYQSLPSNPKILRWRNNAQWARLKLVQDGYLASDSPRGVWEITEAGRQRVREMGG